MVDAFKRPFYISEESAKKLILAFDALVDDVVDDGELNLKEVSKRTEALKALRVLVGR
jgi:hypothetical protein